MFLCVSSQAGDNGVSSRHLMVSVRNLNDRVAELEKDRELLITQLKQSGRYVTKHSNMILFQIV